MSTFILLKGNQDRDGAEFFFNFNEKKTEAMVFGPAHHDMSSEFHDEQ